MDLEAVREALANGQKRLRITTHAQWDVAQEVQDLVKAFFTWVETHTLPKPVATIVFPTKAAA